MQISCCPLCLRQTGQHTSKWIIRTAFHNVDAARRLQFPLPQQPHPLQSGFVRWIESHIVLTGGDIALQALLRVNVAFKHAVLHHRPRRSRWKHRMAATTPSLARPPNAQKLLASIHFMLTAGRFSASRAVGGVLATPT